MDADQDPALPVRPRVARIPLNPHPALPVAALQRGLQNFRLRDNRTKTNINGRAVVTETILTLKSPNDPTKLEKFREFTLDDGSTVRELIGMVDKPKDFIEKERGYSSVEPWEFSESAKTWVKLKMPSFTSSPLEEGQINMVEKALFDELKLMTYNVWFSQINQINRALGFVDLLRQHSPDVACVQEATDTFLKLIASTGFVQKNYILSDVHGNTLEGGNAFKYGVAMLLKKPIFCHEVDLRLYYFPSQMGRRPLIINLSINKDKKMHRLVIATMHLESSQGELRKTYRCLQQKRVFQMLDQMTDDVDGEVLKIFCGDFNYDPADEFEDEDDQQRFSYPRGYIDSNVAMKGDTCTFVEADGKQRRIDRVVMSSKSSVVAEHIVIGRDPTVVMPAEEYKSDEFKMYEATALRQATDQGITDLTPVKEYLLNVGRRVSDHYGIVTTIRYDPNSK